MSLAKRSKQAGSHLEHPSLFVRAGAPHAAGCPHAALACGGFEPSSGRGIGHDAVRANATGIQIRLRISRISSSLKQLLVGHVSFRFGTIGLQELIEAEEFAAEGAAVDGPFGFAGVDGERHLTAAELAARLRALDALASGKVRPSLP